MDADTLLKVGGSIVVIVLLIIVGIAIFRRIGGEVRGKRGSRLGVVEYQEVDKLRHMVIVRRDNAEHLLLIGGPQDIVIETNIGESSNRPAGVRRMPPPDAKAPPASPPPAYEPAPQAAYDEYGEPRDDHMPSLGPAGPRPRR